MKFVQKFYYSKKLISLKIKKFSLLINILAISIMVHKTYMPNKELQFSLRNLWIISKYLSTARDIEIEFGFKFTIINCYIAPHQSFAYREVSNILNYFTMPIIIMRDFNAWSSLWASLIGIKEVKSIKINVKLSSHTKSIHNNDHFPIIIFL